MFLDTGLGGVNVSNLSNTLMCKQIKLIYKIKISEKANWNSTGKHWLQKFATEFFLCKCSSIKGLNISDMPYFYQSSKISWALFSPAQRGMGIDSVSYWLI